MATPATTRLYLQDDHCFEIDARIVAIKESSLAFDETCFYPGGGGQPADEGSVRLRSGELLKIVSVYADADEIIWHISQSPPSPNIVGQSCRLSVDKARRLALMRYHTVLHVLNTIALRDYGGWITGVQIGTDYSRIDFKLDGFSAAMRAELDRVLAETDLWDGKVKGIVVTDIKNQVVEVRALISAADSGKQWDLRCLVREKMLDWLQRQGQSLPKLRLDVRNVEGGVRREHG